MYRSVLITGAGSGFGEGTAIGLAKRCQSVIAAAQSWPQVTDDARSPEPRDPVFLNALAGALYELIWLKGNDMVITLDLTGPASDYRCENEIELLSMNGYVLDLKVLESDTQHDITSSP